MPLPAKVPASIEPDPFDLDDEDGWQDMPVIREDKFASGLDEEDQRKYHYMPSAKGTSAANATGNLIDVDGLGNEWRSKIDQNESEYTRLRVNEEDDADEVHLRTRYLFDEDKAMTPLSQMQATKNLLTEAQRIAYVGLCALTSREMSQALKIVQRKELKAAVTSMELWAMKIMGRLYYHMELETQEQKMIESLAQHGVQALDLVPALMTTHTVANPEYDPEDARLNAMHLDNSVDDLDGESMSGETIVEPSLSSPHNKTPTSPKFTFSPHTPNTATPKPPQTTTKVLGEATASIPGVSTSLSSADKNVTLDIRWTVLCDLFLILIADSVYDARSRVLLESVAAKLGLGWLDVVKFESRVTEALEIQEDVEKMEQQDVIEGRMKSARKRRYMMLGLATLGGGLVIGLSAGLLAPVIGAGLGAAFTTIGITGTTGFLAGAGGAAVITTGGVLTGSGIAVRGMANRTRQVRIFDVLPLHNNKRVNCILTVPGFMNGIQDDVRLPFSVLDPIVGDVFSVLWEPDMIRETGSALKILTGEVLSQIGQTVLQATVMTALMSALQWPIILTKLGYLIDNPWNNALDRAKAAGSVLADVLMQRHLGVRPITLIGFSLGARVIFFALLELAKHKAFGVVQDVFLLGATLSISTKTWCETRSVVSGRYVNAFAQNDWVLNYLFRATSGGVGTVAGLRPIQDVPGLENVDVTDKISGHMSYRAFMPLILDQLGFPVSADYFDEPEEPDFEGDRIVVREEDQLKKKRWFSRKKKSSTPSQHVSRPPSSASFTTTSHKRTSSSTDLDDDLPPRTNGKAGGHQDFSLPSSAGTTTPVTVGSTEDGESTAHLPLRAGFDFDAIKEILGKSELNPDELKLPNQNRFAAPVIPPPTQRSESTPRPLHSSTPPALTELTRSSLDSSLDTGSSTSKSPLGASFSRSVSVNNVPSRDHSEDDSSEDDDSNSMRSPSPGMSLRGSTSIATPQPFHAPTLSFAGEDGPLWGGGTNDSAFSHTSIHRSADLPSFGGVKGVFRAFPPPSFDNPFAATPTSTPGISFGSADGSISFAPSSDPWLAPSDDGKKKANNTFNSNPWR